MFFDNFRNELEHDELEVQALTLQNFSTISKTSCTWIRHLQNNLH
jgi:hypothetical protein